MGGWLEFKCGSCGYEVMVSGRDDVGFSARTTTVLCNDCEKLYDVVTFKVPGGMGTERKPTGTIEPECPKSNEHAIRRWTHPDVCPKCGDEMLMGDKLTLWD